MMRPNATCRRAVLSGALSVGVVFAVAAVAERILLPNLEPQAVRVLHAGRAVVACAVAGIAVAWTLLRSEGAIPNGEEPERVAAWFVQLRWVASIVVAMLAFIATQIPGLLAPGARIPLLSVVAAIPLTNLIHSALLARGRTAPHGLLLQALGDLVLLSLILHWSGGIENPFAAVMVLHVVIAGIVLPPAQCYAVASAAAGLSALLAVSEFTGLVPHNPLGPQYGVYGAHRALQPMFVAVWTTAQCALLFGVARFAAVVSERARRANDHLIEMAERALSQRQLLEQALETTGSGLRLVSADLEPTWQSSLWLEWFGPTDCPPAATAAVRRSLENSTVRAIETTLRGVADSSGRPRNRVFRITAAPVRVGSSSTHQVAQLAQDVTAEKHAQKEMVRTGKLVAVGELAAVVAHEVNNPIAILGAKAQLLLSNYGNAMPTKAQQELFKIVELSERVASIAQGLLSACRPTRGARKRLDLRTPIRRMLGMIEAERERLGVAVEDRLVDPLWVNANGSEMEQVFLNLFLNSLHAMPRGGKLTVNSISDGMDAASCAVAVEDTGSGIPRDHLERIWEPFFSTKSEGRGSGLGLSVCLSLVQAHGGTIDVESEPEHGTRMLVRLPEASHVNELHEEAEHAQAAHPGG